MDVELLRQNLKAVIASARAALLALPDEDGEQRPVCPACKSPRYAATPSPEAPGRVTCLQCGISWRVVEVGEMEVADHG